jgi:DNA-binding GntR family transcriptional regulator
MQTEWREKRAACYLGYRDSRYHVKQPDKQDLTQARDEHWAMIRALEEGGRATLVDLCKNHIGPSRDAYFAAVEAKAAHGNPDSARGEV